MKVMNTFFTLSCRALSLSLLSSCLNLSFAPLPLILISYHSLPLRILFAGKKRHTFTAHSPQKHEIFILITAVTEQSCALLKTHYETSVKAPICFEKSLGDKITYACVVCEQMYLIILVLPAAQDSTLSYEISLLSVKRRKNRDVLYLF